MLKPSSRLASKFFLLTALVALLSACARAPSPALLRGAGEGENAAAGGRILNRGNGPEPDSLDPQRARQDSSLNILRDLFEGLTSLDRNANVIPAAAESWTVSGDGLIYTFHLRDGLRWSNGDALTASDFQFALRRLVDAATASEYAQLVSPIANAGAITAGKLPSETLGVDAPDPRTLVMRLTVPAPYITGLLAHPATFPVHQPSLRQLGEGFNRPGVLISNGAFVLTEWTVGSHVAVRKNAAYWNAANTRLDGVRFYHMQDAGAELRRFRAHELHYTYTIPAQKFGWLRDQYREQLHIDPQLGVYYYGFNLTRAPFKDKPGLRRALSLVIDRERLARQVTALGEGPACSWVPDGTGAYTPQRFDFCSRPYDQRVAEARELYAAAGYSAANPLNVEIRYSSGDLHNKIAIAVAALWKQSLGVRATLRGEEFRALNQAIRARTDVQVFRASWIGDYNDAWSFLQLGQSKFGINLTGYSNEEFDSLLAQAATEPDALRRRALLQKAESIFLADNAVMPLYFYVSKHLISDEVGGFGNNVLNVQYSKDMWLH